MNRLTIIGNLTRDPQLRTTQGGVNVCDFTVAVNRRLTAQQRQNGQQAEADFFRVTAGRELGDNCSKYLAKGRKVAVTGPVSARTYQGNDGKTYCSLEVMANDVEFLTPKSEVMAQMPVGAAPGWPEPEKDPQMGFLPVETDELPF